MQESQAKSKKKERKWMQPWRASSGAQLEPNLSELELEN
jgi:hypothetical protein